MDNNQMDAELDSSENDVVDTPVETVESLRAQLDKANAEAAKYRKQKNAVIQEREALKQKSATEESANYETLYKQSLAELTKVKDMTKKQAVTAAIKETLMKQGVLKDAINDAARLVDTSMVNWDEDDGVDAFSVESAIKSLKVTSKYLFETKVAPTGDPKAPKNGATMDESVMTRREFDAIKDPVKRAKVSQTYKIID